MTSNPVVSVIIPNYNHEAYLTERIESVLNQTFRDFEVIILDDCSPDNSKVVIDSYRNNSHVSHIVFNEKNTGNTFIQWKKGLALAKGEFIWLAESDDVADKCFLEKTIGHFKDQKVSIALCISEIVDAEGKTTPFLGHTHYPNNQVWESFDATGPVYEGEQLIANQFLFFNQIVNASSVLVRKSALETALHKFNINKYKLFGDWLIWLSIIQHQHLAVEPQVLNYFRIHEGTVRSSSKNKMFTYFEYQGLLEDFFLQLSLTQDQKRKIADHLVYIYHNRYRTEEKRRLSNFLKHLAMTVKLSGKSAAYSFTQLFC